MRSNSRVHKLPRICNLQQDSHLCASQEICNDNVGLPHETPCGSSFGHPWTNSSVVNEWQIVLIICRICSLQQPMSRFIQYHQKLFDSTRMCTCIAQSAEGLTHARQELQRLSAILVVMVLSVATHSIVVQLRFMEEDHNPQNGIQGCVLPVNQTWKCRFLGKQDQGMVDHGTVMACRHAHSRVSKCSFVFSSSICRSFNSKAQSVIAACMICLCWHASATPVDAEDTCMVSPQSVDNAVCARCRCGSLGEVLRPNASSRW